MEASRSDEGCVAGLGKRDVARSLTCADEILVDIRDHSYSRNTFGVMGDSALSVVFVAFLSLPLS